MPTAIGLIPALWLAAAMAVYAFEPVRSDYADRWRTRRRPGRGG